MYLKPPLYNEILDIIQLLRIFKSTGHDNVGRFFIRIECDLFAPYVTQLCTGSLSSNLDCFPTVWKLLKLFQYLKVAQFRTNVNNYIVLSRCYLRFLKLWKN